MAIRAGNTPSMHIRLIVMATVNSIPMLDVPGWLDNAIEPNEPMVVRALNRTARGVLDIRAAAEPASLRSRITR